MPMNRLGLDPLTVSKLEIRLECFFARMFVYPHPHANFSSFTDFIHATLDIISGYSTFIVGGKTSSVLPLCLPLIPNI